MCVLWRKNAYNARNQANFPSLAGFARRMRSIKILAWRCSQLAFMTTTSDGVAAIRLWTQYHRAIGVELFYMFVNGQVCQDLSLQPVHPCTAKQLLYGSDSTLPGTATLC